MRGLAAALVVTVGLAACGEGPEEDARRTVSGTCGLPSANPNADPSLVPEPLLIDGAELARARRGAGRISVLLNVAGTVQETFKTYKDAIAAAGFEIVGEDNEGFEAEIYIRKDKELGAIQIRTSTCDDAVIVFLNFVEGPQANTLPSPTRGETPRPTGPGP